MSAIITNKRFHLRHLLFSLNIFFMLIGNAIIGIRGGFIGDLIKFLLLGMFFVFVFVQKKPKTMDKTIILFIFFMLCFCIFQGVIWGVWSSSIKLFLGVIIFGVFSVYGDEELLRIIISVVKLCAFLVSLNAIYWIFLNGSFEFYRLNTWLDKQFYTIYYALSYAFCLVDFINDRNKKLNGLLFLFLLFINLALIQSKLSLFSIPFAFIMIWIKAGKKLRMKLSKALRFVLIIICTLLIIIPQYILPNEIKLAFNMLFSADIFNVDIVNNIDKTYLMRQVIRELCIELYFQNPIMGIGLGNIGNYLHKQDSLINEVGEAESSFFQIISEGGTVYLIIMAFLFYMLSKKSLKFINISHSNIVLYPILIIITYIILFIGNDFIDLFFWIVIGIIASIVLSNRNNVKKVKIS